MLTARFIVADVFDGLAQLEDGSIDLVVTSPPFLALRSYLPADHPDKSKEIGSEATPAEFLDTLLAVTAELRRVLAPHGSIAVELGDTYSGSSMSGGDDATNDRYPAGRSGATYGNGRTATKGGGDGWPLAKSVCMIPEAYRFALAYGFNPFTGQPSPAGKWRVRNKVTWCRPNPPVGALGDKWRPATSDVVVACVSPKRYWDDLATRKPFSENTNQSDSPERPRAEFPNQRHRIGPQVNTHSGAPLLDYWEIPPGGYQGAHYAVFPPALVEPLVKAMGPQKVCLTCGEPSRRIVEQTEEYAEFRRKVTEGELAHESTWAAKSERGAADGRAVGGLVSGAGRDPSGRAIGSRNAIHRSGDKFRTAGFTDCGHDDYRPGIILDPFAGSGTTLMVATGHGLDAIGIDLDERNAALARDRVGPMFFEVEAR